MVYTWRGASLSTYNPKVLILGFGEHGKDEFAERLAPLIRATFVSSSKFASEHVVFPWFKEKFPDHYGTPDQCFRDRRNQRRTWHELIAEYNASDPARLAKEILAKHDFYVGMRSAIELQECVRQSLFDYIFWVDASLRKTPEGYDSCPICYDYRIMRLVNNNDALADLQRTAEFTAQSILNSQ